MSKKIRNTEQTKCQHCGKRLKKYPGVGRPKQVCSSACRQAAYRKRLKAAQ